MSVTEFARNLFYEQYCLSIPKPTDSFSHKTVIITGANTGLGKEAARHISRLGCTRLILGVRNTTAGEEARKEILATTSAPESGIAVWKVDLGSFDSVAEFVKRAFRELDRLDVLICNAGINTKQFAEAEGHERMLTVNVLSTYLMASRLLPLLEKTAAVGPVAGDPDPRPPHLSIVCSDTHLLSKFPERNESPDKILAAITANCKNDSSRFGRQYPTSKLLVILLVRDMVYRQKRSGPSTGINAAAKPQEKCPVIINAPNPGLCHSNLTREMPGFAVRVIKTIFRARPTEMGGGALVNAASAGWETNGQYLSSSIVQKGGASTWDSALGEKLCTAVEEYLKTVDTTGH
ncbi:short-chain dehydrogenase [Lipomyces tetrasporus]|uniref:Short-chain dehydrogenase n=1 Tax=Lipomyces tetrasporus TaxID=54092 RepID=A0AAD7VU52_9ASCO|nr:short-chain dehydrogenase [Lipomyces tetrasporus]KAJ8100825.1 short-chain dehydrogenase [Lipomyces tetrasporus]